MNGFPLLSVITFLPLVGALLLLFINGEPALVARNARWVALWTSLITLILSIYLWLAFDRSSAEFQFLERVQWMRDFGMVYQMGVDGISMPFVLLSAVLTPICVLASWDAIQTRVKEYMRTISAPCPICGNGCNVPSGRRRSLPRYSAASFMKSKSPTACPSSRCRCPAVSKPDHSSSNW